MIRFLHRYIFRSIGYVIAYGVISSALWLSACQHKPETPAARQRKAANLQQSLGGGSEAIQTYLRGTSSVPVKRIPTRSE